MSFYEDKEQKIKCMTLECKGMLSDSKTGSESEIYYEK